MEIEIVGVKELDYTNKSGRRVNGVILYYTYEDRNVNGHACDSVYLPVNLYNTSVRDFPVTGNLYFDKNGKVIKFETF